MNSQEKLGRFANQSKSCTRISPIYTIFIRIFPLTSPLETNTEPVSLFIRGVRGVSSPDLSPLGAQLEASKEGGFPGSSP